jgi:ribosomal protein S24E
MEIKIEEENTNIFLDRKEYKLLIIHEGEPTPKRIDVFKNIIEKLSLEPDKTVLIYLKTERGKNTTRALIYYYPNGIDWSTIEPFKRKVMEIGKEEPEEES